MVWQSVPRANFIFLHAARLAFAHPVTGAPVDVSSPLPPDLEAALSLAGAE